MNKVQLIGRVTKDIEIRRTPNNKSVTSFTLAVNRKGKDAGTDFINCVAWNSLADTLGTYVKKGHRIAIVGRVTTRSYEDKQTLKTVYVTEIVVDEMDFLESKQQNTYEPTYGYEQPKQAEPYYEEPKEKEYSNLYINGYDDELPF